MVMVELPEPGAAIDAGAKLTVTPAGCPVADKATAELNPPETAVVMVDLPVSPATVSEAGDAEMVKLGVPGAVTVSVTVVVWVTLPPVPVTVIG